MKNYIYLFLILTMVFSSCETEEPIPTYTLSTSVSPTEGGKITVSPQSPNYKEGEVVTLTAEPNEGWVFEKWDGDGSGSANSLQITMNSNKSVVGVFVKRDYPLTITIEGEGTVEEKIVTNPGGREYPHGTTVELTPKPKEGWVFESWSGDLTGTESPKTITVDKEKNVTVKFKRRDYPLNITIEGEGTVEEKIVTNPVGREYPFQTVVELTPVPKEGWVFESWGGDLTGTESPKTITVDKEKNVTVKFKRRDYPLNITIEGEGTVEEKIVNNPGGREYPFQTVVELTPVPKEGWVFESWGGDLTGTESPKTITVDKEKNVTVKFKRKLIFKLGDNGVTCICENVKPGDKGLINGIEFEAVDNELIRVRRNEKANMNRLCTSLVTDMSGLFMGSPRNPNDFNQPIGNWDVSNVVNMSKMFHNANFNQPIGDWDVGKVRNMSGMFSGRNNQERSLFNQSIEKWNVSSVINMEDMFRLSQFNQPIGNWNVGKVTSMFGMFAFSPFNQPIGNWNVGNVTNMYAMFAGTPFNQPIGNWDVDSVINMSSMFNGTSFNQPIGNWDVSNVTDMSGMFGFSEFNQPIGNWDVSNVTDMSGMFAVYNSIFVAKFNQPLENWNVGKVENMREMFFQNKAFNQPIGHWNVKNVTNMTSMFSRSIFNQNVSKWCVPTITSEPLDFSSNSPLTPENKPKWGTCPD